MSVVPESRQPPTRTNHIETEFFRWFAARCRIKLTRTAIVSCHLMRVALFQPDIPQNAATIIRLAACFGIAVDVIEPCGFLFSDAGFRRAGMDYLDVAGVAHHASWDAFLRSRRGRIVLMTTQAPVAYTAYSFLPNDVILLGRETAGVPVSVHEAADVRLRIPMQPGRRSLNVAMTAAIAVAEALRQTGQFPNSREGDHE